MKNISVYEDGSSWRVMYEHSELNMGQYTASFRTDWLICFQDRWQLYEDVSRSDGKSLFFWAKGIKLQYKNWTIA